MISWLIKFIFRGIAFCFLILMVYIVFPTSNPAVPSQFSPIPNRTGVLEVNDRLVKAEILTREINGAEDIVFSKSGKMFTGDLEGVIWEVDPNSGEKRKFARTNGRPLSLRFDSSENLIVADAYLGLLSINKEGRVTQLCTETTDGVPIRFADFVDITKDGAIYLSDASTFDLKHFVNDLFTGVPTGRIVRYDPKDGKCVSVADKFFFANGILLVDNDDALLVAETFKARVTKLYLNGPKKGQRETFINTPGLPDNLYRGSNGIVYVCLPTARDPGLEGIQENSFAKQAAWKVISLLHDLFGYLPAKPYGHIIAVDEKTGKVVKSWEDPQGVTVPLVTAAMEHEGYLYLGSYKKSYIAKLKL